MRYVVILLAACLFGLLAYGIAAQSPDASIDAALDGGNKPKAPIASLALLGSDGKTSLDSYRGRYVLVNIWASWCPPCRAEAPLVEKIHRVMKSHGATVVGIDSLDNSDDAAAFVDRFHLTYPSLRDRSGGYAKRWGTLGYPESFLLDREGRIVSTMRGSLSQRWFDRTVLPAIKRQ